MKTAAEINSWAMKHYEYYREFAPINRKQRVMPTPEQAADYTRIVHTLQCYYENNYPFGMKQLSHDEAEELERRKSEYQDLALDMRDVLFEENGKKGLMSVIGITLVPAMFDEFPERYDDIYKGWGYCWCVPVVKQQKYGLVRFDRRKTDWKLLSECKYDRVYRLFQFHIAYFVCELDDRKGLLDPYSGDEIVPCKYDEILIPDAADADGCLLFILGDKYGIFCGGCATEAIFDKVIVESEDYVRARIEDDWYYIDKDGQPTQNQHEAFFGSWYDLEK